MTETIAMTVNRKLGIMHPIDARRVFRANEMTLTDSMRNIDAKIRYVNVLVDENPNGRPISARPLGGQIAGVIPVDASQKASLRTAAINDLLSDANTIVKTQEQTVRRAEKAYSISTNQSFGLVLVGALAMIDGAILTGAATQVGLIVGGLITLVSGAILASRIEKTWTSNWNKVTALAGKSVEEVPGIVATLLGPG